MNIAHRKQTSENQTKFWGRCQCKFWLSNGASHQGPLRSRPVCSEPVWATSPQEAHKILTASDDYQWVIIYDRPEERDRLQLWPEVISKPWDLPEDDPNYCPF